MAKSSNHLRGVKIEVPEVRYKADLELHDRFQNFSAEVLRLSLAGIAVIGFLLTLLLGDGDALGRRVLRLEDVRLSLTVSVIAFGVAVALSLLHKFLASDGIYHHLRAIKHLILVERASEGGRKHAHAEAICAVAERDEAARTRKFFWSEIALYGGAAFLAAGAFSAALAFVAVLSNVSSPP
jgi:hypothetical protein